METTERPHPGRDMSGGTQSANLTRLDMIGGALAAIMMIGPLFFAFLGR